MKVGGSFQQSFLFTNNSLDPLSVGPSYIKPSVISSCSSSPTSASVASHASKAFLVTCNAANADGVGALDVIIDGVNAEVTVNVNTESITPKAAVVNALPSSVNRQVFNIQNLSHTKKDTVDIVTMCVTFSCTLQTPTPLIVDTNSTKPDTVQYTSGAIGSSGTVGIVGTLRHPTTSIDTGWVTAQVPAPQIPTVLLTPHNGDNHLVGLCIASCFDVMASYSTPAYTSRDVARSAALVYSSAQAHAMGLIQADVFDPSVRHSQKFSLQLRQANGSSVTFTNGSTELFFKQDSAITTRIAGQFDATGLSSGVQLDTIVVKNVWSSGPDSGTTTQSAFQSPIFIVNEQASPFGAGWSLAGLQRLYFPSDTTMLVVTDGAGSITRFSRGCQACTATAVAADFSTLVRTVDGGGTVTGYRRRYRDGSTATFNTSGYLTSISNRFADSTKYAYDGSNHVQTITDPAGKTLTFAYTSGKLATITDPGGRVSHFAVNASGDLASIADPTNTTTFAGTYDASHRLTQMTDRAGGTWKYLYDFAGKLASDSTPTIKVDMTISGTGTLTTNRLGGAVQSLESSILPPTGKGTSTNPADQRNSSAVRAVAYAITGDSTRYALDRFGAATQIERPTLRDTTFFVRDWDDRVTSSIERTKGKTVSFARATYSGPRVVSQLDTLSGANISYTYDTTFDLVTLISGSGQQVHNYLNAAKSLVDSNRVGVASNPVTRFKYDSKGRDTLIVDAQGDTTRYYFNSTGFQNHETTFNGLNATIYRYDSLFGRLVRTLNPRRDSTMMTLDLLNRVQAVRAPGGATTTYAFDSLSHIRQITDAKGQVYTYHFNALGWTDTITDAASSKTIADRRDVFEYTKTGATRATIDRNHWRTSHIFDKWGRDSILNYTDARVSSRSITFAYDTAGLWIAASNTESVDTLSVDSAGLVSTQVAWRSGTRYAVTATSNAQGLLKSRVLATGTGTPTTLQQITYGYDANLRMDTMVVAGDRTLFFRNADGLLTSMQYLTAAGGRIDSVSFGISTVHQVVAANHSAVLGNFNSTYARDSLGRITQRSLRDTVWNYAYDAHSQLTSYVAGMAGDSLHCVADPHYMDGQHCTVFGVLDTVHAQSFQYDSVGNRIDNSPTILAGNRLTSWLGYSLSYDSVGNLVHKTKTGFDQYFYWNSLGQLDSVRTGSSILIFGYDGFGRRVRKTIGGSPSTTFEYIYDGVQVATIDSAGTRIQTLSYFPGSETPHSMMQSTGNRVYYVSEIAAGNVWGMIDSNATVKNHYRYSPFGLLEDSSETVSNSLRHAGREYDRETHLYYNRARYYDPELSRFISEDPIGLNGGQNQYAYVANDPINSIDPSGTCLIAFAYTFYSDGSSCPHGGATITSLGFAGADIGWGNVGGGSVGASPSGSSKVYNCAQTASNQWDCTGEDPATENTSLENWANTEADYCNYQAGCTDGERYDWLANAQGPGDTGGSDGPGRSFDFGMFYVKGREQADAWIGCEDHPIMFINGFSYVNGIPAIAVFSNMNGGVRVGNIRQYSAQLALLGRGGGNFVFGHFDINGTVNCDNGLYKFSGLGGGGTSQISP